MFKTIAGYEHGVFYISSIKKDITSNTLIFYLMNGSSIKEQYTSTDEMNEVYEEYMNNGLFIEIEDRVYNSIHFSTVGKAELDGRFLVNITIRTGESIIGDFDTEAERDEFYDLVMEAQMGGGLKQVDTYSDLPEKGNNTTVYLTKDTGQTYYWDKIQGKYEKTGTAGRTGVYSVDKELPETVGKAIKLKKTDLKEILKPTVAYSEGSEVIGNNSIHGIITSIANTEVEVKTITDLVIDSFRQVAEEKDLPTEGTENILYYLQDKDEFRIWNKTNKKWEEPFHPLIFTDCEVKNARLNSVYCIDGLLKYTKDNKDWIYLNKHIEEYKQNTSYIKDELVYIDGLTARVLADYTSDNTSGKTIKESFKEDIKNNKIILIKGEAQLTKEIISNTDCGATKARTKFEEGMTFTEFAEKILIKEIEPGISFSASGSGLYEVNDIIHGTNLTCTINNLADVTTTITDIKFYKDGTLLDTQAFTDGTRTYTYSYTPDITSSTDGSQIFNVEVNTSTGTKTSSSRFTFAYPSYYGFVDSTSVDETTVKGLGKNLSTSSSYSWSGITANDARFCYAYPASRGSLSSIKDTNNFEYIQSYTVSTVTIDGVLYNVYVLTDPTTVDNFMQDYR